MKRFLLCAAVMLVAAPAFGYTIDDFRREARSHWDRVQKDLGDLEIDQIVTFEAGGAPGTMTSKMYLRGKAWRLETTGAPEGYPPIETVTLFDGSDVWILTMGMKSKLPSNAMGPATGQWFWNEPPEGTVFVGSETVQGRDCWKLSDAKGEPPRTMWFDKASFLPVQLEAKKAGSSIRVVFTDFRKVKGHGFPYATQVLTDGRKTVTTKVLGVRPNAALSRDLFDSSNLAGREGDMNRQMEELKKMQQKGGR